MGMIDRNALTQMPVYRGKKFNPTKYMMPKILSSFKQPAEGEEYVFRGQLDAELGRGNSEWIGQASAQDNAANFRILLIGNEQSGQAIRITLSSHLNLDVNFSEARSGKLALQAISHEMFDLIVYGDEIADMNGLEFLDKLNRQCGKNKIPVIEILKAGAGRDGVQAMKMGAHDYLLKDIDGHHFELLPILVSRIYAEQQTLRVLQKTAGVHQNVADSIPAVIYQLSLQGGRHDVRISSQITAMGFSADQWGNDAELHHQMCHEEDRVIVKNALEHSYKTGTLFQCEYRIKTFNGSLCWFRDKAKIVMDKFGRPLFLQGVMTDISGIKALETELKTYRDMLEKMVQQRTERLDRRVSILESCNSSLSESYGKMHQMYLELLIKSQAI